jgi:hypothetical protein
VVLTDKKEVCAHLRANVAANAGALATAGAIVSVYPLLWRLRRHGEAVQAADEAIEAAEWGAVVRAGGGEGCDGGAFDLVLASECVYVIELLSALLNAMERCVASG